MSELHYKRIDDLGRVVIPKIYREALKIEQGDELEIDLVPCDYGHCIIITKPNMDNVVPISNWRNNG